LATRCFAIDTWSGDPQSGFYGPEVLAALKAVNDSRYGEFSTLVQSTFDAAAARFADRSIDLLHIDGVHGYESVRHDYETWLPKLSDQAVVLFHDIVVRDPGFGVQQLWSELRMSHLNFEFLHEYGLGVLVVGANVADPVRRLCTPTDQAYIDRIRQRFGVLAEYARVPAHEEVWKRLALERDTALAQLAAQTQATSVQAARADDLEAALGIMQSSRFWRMTAPLRSLVDMVRQKG
jgi:hypothetical protein